MKPPTDTIDLIRSTLQTGIVSSAVEQAAVTYARLSQDCSARLERIAAMLAKGSDYQALQAAEEEPPLLDLAAALSFGGEKAWLDFCQAHRLPVAPRLDARTVQALDRLYAQGVTANHPLYKDFRAAVLSRENEKALRIVRTILKLNPGDDNARAELQRLENKQWQESMEELRAALKTDDEERIAVLVEKIAMTVPEDKRAGAAEFIQAEGVRQALRRRQAEEKIPSLIAEGEKHQAAGEWEAVLLACEMVGDLISKHDLRLDGSLRSAFEALTAACSQRRNAIERQRAFERSLSGFQAFVQEAETRLLTGTPPRLSEAASLDEQFIRRWRELESHGLPVAEDVLTRLRQVGQKIRSALEHARNRVRARAFLSAAALIAFLLAVAGVAWHGWQARAYALDLASYKARQLAEPAAKLVAVLKSEHPLLLRWPYLRTRIEETEAWTGQSQGLLVQAEVALKSLEAEFGSLKPAEVLKRLEDARALAAQLPGDVAAGLNQRISALKTKSELMLTDLGAKRSQEVRRQLEGMAGELKSGLSFENPAVEVEAAVAKLESQVARLEAYTRPEAASLQLPADVEAQIRNARQRLQTFREALLRLGEVREKTAAATSLAEYRNALSLWQEIAFIEAAPAASAVNALPTEEQFLASLLMNGDLAMWKAAVEDVSGAAMHPETPQEHDLKVLLALRDDPNLNGIWENVIVDHSSGRGKRSVWSLGPLSEGRIGDSQRRWSGKAFDPHPEDTGAAFIQQDFKRLAIGGGSEQGQSVLSSRPSTTGTLVKSLQLDRMTDANGEKFERSLLDTLDRLMGDATAPPLAKAYIMLELERLTRDRPFAWGWHLCASLRADLAELHRLIGSYPLRSEDWMIPKVRAQFDGALEGFFSSRQAPQYEKEAQARRVLIMRVVAASVRFGGFVDTDRRVKLNNAARAAQEVWLATKSSPKPVAAGTASVSAEVPPFTPVLFLPLDRQELLRDYHGSLAGKASASAGSAPSETPFLK